jgi:hypothetical protein
MKKIVELRALSIAQPWAQCIVGKGKNVENRSWNTKYRGYFAIHASQSKDDDRFEYCLSEYRIKFDKNNIPLGAIVGFAELVDVVTEDALTQGTKRWFQGEYGFVLKNVIRLKDPVTAKGALSFWKLKGRVLKAVLAQLSAAQIKKIQGRALSK